MMNQAGKLGAVSEFEYDLPPELIAKEPPAERDASRLMVLERATGRIAHEAIAELPRLLEPGDLVVVNNTRVMPARIRAFKQSTGGRVELLLLHRRPEGIWRALARPAKSLRPGTGLSAETPPVAEPVELEVTDVFGDGEIDVRFLNEAQVDFDAIGSAPFPPYLKGSTASFDRYQTIYAHKTGSAAAPTAGLHITDRLRTQLREHGIGWAEITLHIGLDTFRPVAVEIVGEHRIHREWASLIPDVAARIGGAKAAGNRVIAVGTTSARTLEAWGQLPDAERGAGLEGWVDLFITPGYRWRVVDGMLTNFHLPRSTLIMMVSAFAGIDTIKRAYAEAIARRYRFYSFGDAMLIV
jgi:S-adenosylmethionine:tRNA ribosyltransferase-isomerase